MVKAKAKDLRDRWLDTSERLRRGFARIEVKAITEWLLEGERVVMACAGKAKAASRLTWVGRSNFGASEV